FRPSRARPRPATRGGSRGWPSIGLGGGSSADDVWELGPSQRSGASKSSSPAMPTSGNRAERRAGGSGAPPRAGDRGRARCGGPRAGGVGERGGQIDHAGGLIDGGRL